MKQYHSTVHRRAVLVFLLALSLHTEAFTSLRPIVGRPLAVTDTSKPLIPAKEAPHGKLHLFNDNNNNNNSGDDWKHMADAAGQFARTVGGKAWNLVEKGGSKVIEKGGAKLRDIAAKGAASLKEALLPETAKATKENQVMFRKPVIDTQDEALFRSILEEDELPDPFAAADALDLVIDQAALILQEDAMAALVLGGSIQHSFPISQSRQSRIVDGKRETTAEATFEVWGLQGRGMASITAVDGELTALQLEVDDQKFAIGLTPTASGAPKTSKTQPPPQPWEPADVETVLEVEVMKGVRRLNPPKGGRVIDAEILDKTIIL